jgi:hypothetical protein
MEGHSEVKIAKYEVYQLINIAQLTLCYGILILCCSIAQHVVR